MLRLRRRRVVRAAAAVVLAAGIFGCRKAGPCRKDTDCKGVRICESGACVTPARTGETPPPKARPPATPPPAPPPFVRGGPGGMPVAVRGPAKAPKVLWQVPLGAVIFARALVTRPEGEDRDLAYVGTHSGRFVAVVVEGPEAGTVRFERQLGGMIWSTPALVGGRVFVGADDDVLYGMDARTGAIEVRRKVGDCKAVRAPGPEGARCDVDGGPTPAPDGGLYVGADGIYRLTADGSVLWRYPPPGATGPHVFSTPLVANGIVYAGTQGAGFVALRSDGTPVFTFPVAADVDGSPALAPGPTVIFGADDGSVYGLSPEGKLRFRYRTDKDVRSAVAVSSLGRIYVTSFDGRLHVLTPEGDLLWTLATGGPIMSSPVLDAADVAYFGSQDDHLYAVGPEGRVLWALDLGADVDASVAFSSAGTIVVGADDGVLRGIGAAG